MPVPLTTTYIVVPFVAGANGTLHPGAPRLSTSRPSALAMADGLAPIYAGVIVLRDRADPAADIFLEPLLICTLGQVPSHFLPGFSEQAAHAVALANPVGRSRDWAGR